MRVDTFFWGKIVQPLFDAVKREHTLAYLREIEGIPFMDPQEIGRYRLAILRDLIEHCSRNVPYYRDLFKSIGLTHNDISSLEDFRRIPVMTRDDAVRHGTDLIAQNMSDDRMIKKSTGGSTGTPLDLYWSRDYYERCDAGMLRQFEAAGYRVGEAYAMLWVMPVRLSREPAWRRRIRQSLRRKYFLDTSTYGPEQFDAWFDICKNIRPTILYGYASTAFEFAKYMERKKLKLPWIKGVFVTAETLFPFQRDAIEQAFRCKVFNQYGCTEAMHLGCECPNGRMHAMEDFSIVETARDEKAGLDYFIVTSLWNYAFPLLRYRNNDVGSLVEGSCQCGNNFGLFDLNITRVYDNFPTPNGNIIHATRLIHSMYGIEGIDKYQFYQPQIDRIVLYIRKDTPRTKISAEKLRYVRNQIDDLTSNTVKFDVEFVHDIPLSRAGKYHFIRSDVRNE